MRIAFVFDMDGVLFDTHPLHRNAWRQVLRQAGKDVSETDVDFVLEGGTRQEILRHFLGPLNPQQFALFAYQKDAIFQEEENGVQTIKGLKTFLGHAESASIPMAVASSGSRARVTRMLQSRGLANCFSAVLTADDVSAGKSNLEIFLQAAKKLRARPRNVLVFEDATASIRLVKRIGMRCIGIATGGRREDLIKAGADLVVPDYIHLKMSDVFGLFQNSAVNVPSVSA
jgi:HAD superfamily hydrolase (TIGR01509 family)